MLGLSPWKQTVQSIFIIMADIFCKEHKSFKVNLLHVLTGGTILHPNT
jgi:hypothetical protein